MIELIFGRGSWLVLASIFICFVLHYVPVDGWLAYARPMWVVLLVVYWGHILPSRFGIWASWLIGLYLDVLLGAHFGTYAISLVVISYVTYLLHRRIRVFSLVQQMVVAGVLVGIFLLMLRLLLSFFGDVNPLNIWYWVPVVSSALVWPWFYVILENLRRRFFIFEANV